MLFKSLSRLKKIDTSAIDHGLLVSAESKIYLPGKVPCYYGHKVSKLSSECTMLQVAHLLFMGRIPNKNDYNQFVNEFNKYLIHSCQHLTNNQLNLQTYNLHPSTFLGILLKLKSINFINIADVWNPLLHYGLCAAIISRYRNLYNGITVDSFNDNIQTFDDIINNLFPINQKQLSESHIKLLQSLLIVYADHGFSTPTYVSRLAISEQNNLSTSIAAASLCYESLNPMINYTEISNFFNETNTSFQESINNINVTDRGLPYLLRSCQSTFLDPRAVILMNLWHYSDIKNAVQLINDNLKPKFYLKSDFILLMILQDIHTQIMNNAFVDLHLLQSFITLARIPGWISHCLEQKSVGRRIEHTHAYIGPTINNN